MTISVLLIDNNLLFRQTLRMYLDLYPALFDVTDVDNGLDGLRLIDQLHPDIVITDRDLPGPGGLEMIRNLFDRSSSTKGIIISAHDEEGFIREAFQAGAYGYIDKREIALHMVAAICTVAAGNTYISSAYELPG